MYVKITTTLTTLIDVETMTPETSAEIDAEEGLPHAVIMAAVVGACRATIKGIKGQDDPEDEDGDDVPSPVEPDPIGEED